MRASGATDRPTISLPTQPRPETQTGVRRRPRSMYGVLVVVGLAIAVAASILTLSGGSGYEDYFPPPTTEAEQALPPVAITSFENITGTYRRQGPGGHWYSYFFEDGTLHFSSNPDLVQGRPEVAFQTEFDGTKILMTTERSFCRQPDRGGTYQIQLLENGNLRFVAIGNDPCGSRSGIFPAQWKPVPERQ